MTMVPRGRALSAIGALVVALILSNGGESFAVERPRLVVVISVDQLCQEYLERFAANFSDSGFFRRAARDGATYLECHHRHAFTFTAPGHAVMLTGVYPTVHGVIDNNWYDRRVKKVAYCVEDPEFPIVGSRGDAELKGVSPKSLQCETIGDRWKRRTDGRAKVFGVTVKDRAAVLMAGRKPDGVFWYDNTSGCWVTSRYYANRLPDYLEQLNRPETIAAYAGQAWELLLPADRYRLNHPDDSPFEASFEGLGRAFPHRLASEPNKTFFKQLPATPFGGEMTLEVTRRVVAEEQLGADETTDLLCIGLSSNDYIGHNHGPHSLEVEDATLRTDRLLGELADFLDRQVGVGRWTALLSADHGVAPAPEYAVTRGLPAGRSPLGAFDEFTKQLESHLVEQFGSATAGSYVERVDGNQVFLHAAAVGGDERRFEAVQSAVRDYLSSRPGVAAAAARYELLRDGSLDARWQDLPASLLAPETTLESMLRRTFHAERSGDVVYVLRPYQIHGKTPATHGSPWRYDTHVPLVLVGCGVRSGRFERPTSPAAIAATVARLIGLDDLPEGLERAADEALEGGAR